MYRTQFCGEPKSADKSVKTEPETVPVPDETESPIESTMFDMSDNSESTVPMIAPGGGSELTPVEIIDFNVDKLFP